MQLHYLEQSHSDGSLIGGYASEQRGKPMLVFLHGNGLAGGVYTPMLEQLHASFDLLLFDIPGHGCSEEVTPQIGWNEAAERAHQAAVATGFCQGRPVYGVGHSLGGVLTLLSAYRHPAFYRQLVLLDPIIFPPRMLLLMRIVRLLGLTERFHPHIKSTLRRRRHWENREQVVEYLAARAVFKDWTLHSLNSFSKYAILDASDGVELACDPADEAHFFGALPNGLWRAIRGVKCKSTLLMGQNTYPFSLRAASLAENVNQQFEQVVLPGSHCFMQEYPERAAQQVASALPR